MNVFLKLSYNKMHDTNPKKKVNMSRKDEILNSKNE